MLVLARVITIGAYNRNESWRHYKPEFPERNDEVVKTTMASFQGAFENHSLLMMTSM